ncbi:MAG: M42 family metallopeptidase [Planctomycetaceae bacterium]
MDPQALDFFRTAIETPSPSGYEQPVQRLVRDYISPHAAAVQTDVHGNVIASAGDSNGPRLLLAGHCDQIGMLVTNVDEDGYVYAQTIGGWDPQQLIGQAMTIWSDSGPVPGVISRKPIHLLNENERKQVVLLEQLWLDIGAKSKAEVQEKIRVGDPVTLDLRYRPLMNDIVSGPGMDNKTGMWTVIDSLRRAVQFAKSSHSPLRCHLHSVSTVQEEIGLRGAKTAAGSIDPAVAIAVDVTHASDCPTIDKNQQGVIKLGGGPVIYRGPNMNPAVVDRLISLAKQHSIPYQLAATGRATPNDANVLQIHGRGVATGVVAIPNRYMHSAVEAVSLGDIDHVAELLARFAVSLTPECDFIPK